MKKKIISQQFCDQSQHEADVLDAGLNKLTVPAEIARFRY